MGLMTVLRVIGLVVGIVAGFVVIQREKSGKHHWLHYVPSGLVASSLLDLTEKMYLDRVIAMPPYFLAIIWIVVLCLSFYYLSWVYENGKKLKLEND